MSNAHFSSKIFPFAEQAAARERARIRRLIGPVFKDMRTFNRYPNSFQQSIEMALVLDRSTRPGSKRKVTK